MLPQDFQSWTREQWIEFDNIKSQAFQPTPEEQQAQEEQYKQNLINQVKGLLSNYGIDFTGDEADFTELYTSYIKGGPSELSQPMNEWLGKDERLDEIVNYRVENHNNLKDFCNFILLYE